MTRVITPLSKFPFLAASGPLSIQLYNPKAYKVNEFLFALLHIIQLLQPHHVESSRIELSADSDGARCGQRIG